MMPSNAQLGELMVRAAAEELPGSNREKALQRAARSAFSWPEEARTLVERDQPLTDLPSIGPWLAGILLQWLTSGDAPEAPEPPDLRRGFLTYAEVRATLDANPDWPIQVRADLQMHTTHSDGKASLWQMAEACAREYRYEFVNITDHSKGLKIARGMDEEELAEEAAEIVALNRELEGQKAGLRVLHGIEMNLSPEGEGDMDPDALARLDLVLGAFHSKLRLTEDQTERYLAALRNPTIDVLAHPRGRMFGVRLGLQADWARVFEEALAQDVALEIDAHPNRQDLDVELLELVRDVGCRVSIGTDAHSVGELRYMEFGLAAAIRAGIPRERILNFRPVHDVVEWARESRRARGRP
jgi:histidinol phosphatase-like PHP family hydrolase